MRMIEASTPQRKGRGEEVGGRREGLYHRLHDQCMLVAKHSMQKHKGMMRVIHHIELGFAHPRELGGGVGVGGGLVERNWCAIQQKQINSNYTVHVF